MLSVDPGDVIALPTGTSLIALYHQNSKGNRLYAGGDKVSDDTDLKASVSLLRLVRFIDVGGLTVATQAILPYGKVELDNSSGNQQSVSNSGFGDPIIGATTWLVSDPTSRTWIGVPIYLSLPVGDYGSDRGGINIGENRWKAIFQLGLAKGLSDRIFVELIGEYAIYGDNDDYYGKTLKQDDAVSAMGHLTYKITASSSVSISYYHSWNGESEVDGFNRADEQNNSRWLATVSSWVSPDFNIQFQYGQDIQVENGLRKDGQFNIRLAKLF
ncbi:transporter [Pseudomonas putida]|uniref:transporter n=1 Tax=Pseudomonas putida TaxID=303 RepID=UPI00130DE36D|nr:transporter [Pseudomonas putida]